MNIKTQQISELRKFCYEYQNIENLATVFYNNKIKLKTNLKNSANFKPPQIFKCYTFYICRKWAVLFLLFPTFILVFLIFEILVIIFPTFSHRQDGQPDNVWYPKFAINLFLNHVSMIKSKAYVTYF